MLKYSEGVMEDGAAILKEGQRMTVSEIVAELNTTEAQTAEAGKMKDDLSRIKTAVRRRLLGETTESEHLREVNRLAMKHAHGHYPKEGA